MAEAAAKNLEIHSNRLEQRNRILGRLAIKPEQRLLNNDPLAHVFLRLEAGSFFKIKDQVRAEYRGDMSERSEGVNATGESTQEAPFYAPIDYLLQDDELIYAETGKPLSDLLHEGEMAAKADYDDDPRYHYHYQRAKILRTHQKLITEWRQNNPEVCGMIASLPPPASEVAPEIAKLGNFKLHRQMASMWVLEPTTQGVRLHVFSLDKMTLERLQYIYDELGIGAAVSATTLEEVSKIRPLHTHGGAKALTDIFSIHDDRLDKELAAPSAKHLQGINRPHFSEAYKAVESKPEAEDLYMNAVEAVTESLVGGKTSKLLAEIIMELRSGYPRAELIPDSLRLGSAINLEQARAFMEYLRLQVLSEYIFGDSQAHQKFQMGNDIVFSGQYGSIAAAGSFAVDKGITRESDCPTSPAERLCRTSNSDELISTLLGIYHSKEEFISKWCPNCLPQKKVGQSVKAWRKGDRIGCYNCGREQDICTSRIINRGRTRTEVKGKKVSFVDFLMISIAEYIRETSQKTSATKLRVKNT